MRVYTHDLEQRRVFTLSIPITKAQNDLIERGAAKVGRLKTPLAREILLKAFAELEKA